MTLEDTIRQVVREEISRAFDRLVPAKWEGCIRVREAAKLVGVSTSTIEKWARNGLQIRHKGRVRMVDVAELRAFIAKREATPEQSADDFAKELLGRQH